MPIRSFLRVPLSDNLQGYVDKEGKSFGQSLEGALKSGTMSLFVAKLGIVGEAVVLDGFNSRGFGKWKESNMAHKKIKQTLVETQQHRNSISIS